MKRCILACVLLAFLPTAQAGNSGAVAACRGALSLDVAGIQKRLTAAEARWKERGLDAYRVSIDFEGESGVYSFQLSVPCDDSGWLFVYPVPRPASPGVRASTPVPALVETFTVSGLFAQVRSALSLARGTCGVLKVAFDPHDGHVISLRRDNFAITDDEFLLTTSPLAPEP